MKNESLEGCPRCGDYDKIKDELESNKRKSQDEQKNALKRCEDSKKQLQKKLLTIGAIAIVAGTILGKDFVDKIADYIDSFNDVKSGASKLVGQADTPAPPQVAKEDNKQEEEIDDWFVLEFAPRTFDTDMWPAGMISVDNDMLNLFSGYGNNSIIDLIIDEQLSTMMIPLIEDEMFIPSSSLLDDLTRYAMTFETPLMVFDDFDIPQYESIMPQAYSIVPEMGTLGLLGVPILLPLNNRRR